MIDYLLLVGIALVTIGVFLLVFSSSTIGRKVTRIYAAYFGFLVLVSGIVVIAWPYIPIFDIRHPPGMK